METNVLLTYREALDLALTILEAVDAFEEDEMPRDTLAPELRDWCELLLTRAAGE